MRWNVCCSLVLLHVVMATTQDIKGKHCCHIITPRRSAIFPAGLQLKVVTIATDETDGYVRFTRSAKLFGIDVEVSGGSCLCDL